jgi:hypothetical protein
MCLWKEIHMREAKSIIMCENYREVKNYMICSSHKICFKEKTRKVYFYVANTIRTWKRIRKVEQMKQRLMTVLRGKNSFFMRYWV